MIKSDSKCIYDVQAIQHIKMISERSCNTADWSNDASQE